MVEEWFGWAGTILKVDLTRGKIVKEELTKDFAHKWVGGRGFGIKYLWDEVKEETDPLGPENILVWALGPITGSGCPQGSKSMFIYKSPLTGHYGGGSVGGFIGAELKNAGYDAVVFYGKAEKPVYLWVNDDDVELKDATHLWGKGSLEVMETIMKELGDPLVKVACIGPAGENLVRLAVIRVEFLNAQGKTGGGAVMGSKNLKAIAVRGTKGCKIANPDKFLEYIYGYTEDLQKHPLYTLWSLYGSPGFIGGYIGNNAACNFTENLDLSLYEPDLLVDRYIVRLKSCFACPVHCRRYNTRRVGPYAGRGGGPEVTELAMGTLSSGIVDPGYVMHISEVENELGVDFWQGGMTIAWAIECYERGILTKADTDGLELKWGDTELHEELVHRMAKREGKLGNLLAEGSEVAAKIVGRGSEKWLTTCKGLAGSCRDPRRDYTQAMLYLTGSRGADLQKNLPALVWIGAPKEVLEGIMGTEAANLFVSEDPIEKAKGTAAVVLYSESWTAALEALGQCLYHSLDTAFMHWFPKLLHALTGWETTVEDLMKIGERIYNLERAFSTRCGITRENGYVLSYKFTHVPGPAEGRLIPEETRDKMLDYYFEVRGWDLSTAVPTRAKLEELGLKDVADELEAKFPYPEWDVMHI